jgi:hypothetical protein
VCVCILTLCVYIYICSCVEYVYIFRGYFCVYYVFMLIMYVDWIVFANKIDCKKTKIISNIKKKEKTTWVVDIYIYIRKPMHKKNDKGNEQTKRILNTILI